jgi:hypothetical protein
VKWAALLAAATELAGDIGDMNGLFAKGDGKDGGLNGSTQHLLLRSGVRRWCRWNIEPMGALGVAEAGALAALQTRAVLE